MTDGKGIANLQPKGKVPKDINAPVKPLTGYLRYLNDYREEAKQRHPNLPSRDLLKIMSSNWNALPPEKKEKYFNEAKEENEKYVKEFEAYQKTEAYKNYQILLKEQKETSKPYLPDKFSSIKTSPSLPNGKHTKKKNESSRVHKIKQLNGHRDMGKKHKLNPTNNQSHFDFPIFTSEFMDYNKRREMQAQELRDRLKGKEIEAATLSKTVEFLGDDITRYGHDKARTTVQVSRLQREVDPFKARVVEAFVGANVPPDVSSHLSGKYLQSIGPGNVLGAPLNSDNLEHYLNHLSRAAAQGTPLPDTGAIPHGGRAGHEPNLNELPSLSSSSTSCSLSSVREAISKIFDMEGLS